MSTKERSGEESDPGCIIHESLNRPLLFMGGERELVLMLLTIAGIFIFSLAKVWAAAIGISLWLVGHWILVKAAQFDPQLSKTGPRSLRYRHHYPATATPFAKIREVE
ncbi:VirB3 family type IV secretion system protein [Polynucleobacter sp. 86C-FISCH]|uniref:conjugal transfer protein TrbD n=1 Tax=Polynucleobacter sp. 86C-FISCH TaxID=2689101 RepID=UPI001C0ACC2B|nr:conjugal transfer protein TrbD [Polynucleobacter sp. 86C-FISCH]MBU3595073.1 VirB3 family type IV secretion system protein [Polynucleobacter sp. 86C-FISCH]